MFLNPYRDYVQDDTFVSNQRGHLVKLIGRTPLLELTRSVKGFVPKGIKVLLNSKTPTWWFGKRPHCMGHYQTR